MINSNREQMPPLSYLTLLDYGLIGSVGLVAICLLIVIISAVSSQSFHPALSFFDMFHNLNTFFHQFLRANKCGRQATRLELVNKSRIEKIKVETFSRWRGSSSQWSSLAGQSSSSTSSSRKTMKTLNFKKN